MSRIRNPALFLLLSALWGMSFPAIKTGLDSLPPILFAAFRYDIGGIVLLGYLVASGSKWRPRSREDGVAVLIVAVFVISANGLLFIGQQAVPSGIAAILFGLIPILTAGFAAVLLPSEPITARRLFGVGVGLVGVGIIAQPDPSNLFTTELIGMGYILLSAVSVSLGSVLLRTRSPTVGVGAMTAWAMVVAGGILHTGSFAAGERAADVTFSLLGVAALFYLAVFASAIAYVIYFGLLERFGPLEINLMSYVVPIFATLGGVVLLNETITVGTVVGFLLITSGFVVLKARPLADELRTVF